MSDEVCKRHPIALSLGLASERLPEAELKQYDQKPHEVALARSNETIRRRTVLRSRLAARPFRRGGLTYGMHVSFRAAALTPLIGPLSIDEAVLELSGPSGCTA
ncbi:hypothetical protein [Bradyrhizobium sp. SBR1B]|uniref:hypothetical protein n=1 Tax=Bradyrhizobium sp. SBR1B TaxID=2663836 RepID=UPI001606A20C|nr:hypothetical protein [Bradyrhizobium sp. SBR1B]MBB4380712.1 hypothetical protein [Bradyrhizobium sp. SBR1B]